MSLRPSESTAWLEDIDAFISGEMKSGDVVRFQERLRHDERARLVYVEYLDLHFELLQNAGRLASHDPAAALDRRTRLTLWLSTASVAAALMLAAATLYFWPRPATLVAGAPATAGIVVAPPVELPRAALPIVARIGKAFDASWTDSTLSLQSGSSLRAGDVLDLYRGMVEITFESGARCSLAAQEGVTAFLRIDSALGCTIEAGHATFAVPPTAKGFTVTTSGGRFVDLGTEFGVQADPRGSSQVHVLDGSVEAYGSSDSRLLLQRGAAAQLAASGSPPMAIAFNPDAFARPAALLRGLDEYSKGVRLHVVAPSSLRHGATVTDEVAHLVMERREIRLATAWTSETRNVQEATADGIQKISSFSFPADQRVDSYLIHATPSSANARRELLGQITFRRPILAVISADADLRESRKLFGEPRAEYPDEVGIGLEAVAGGRADDRADEVVLSEDRHTLSFLLNIGPVFDQFRVLVASDGGAAAEPKNDQGESR